MMKPCAVSYAELELLHPFYVGVLVAKGKAPACDVLHTAHLLEIHNII